MNSPSRWPKPSVPGRCLGVAPVATTTASPVRMVPSSISTRRPSTSSRMARCPRTSCTRNSLLLFLSARTAFSGGHVPANTCLDSGGRSYGRCNSSPTSERVPWKPSARSVSTARQPASDAPTTTTEPSTGTPSVVMRRRTWRSTPRASEVGTRNSSCGSRPCPARDRANRGGRERGRRHRAPGPAGC